MYSMGELSCFLLCQIAQTQYNYQVTPMMSNATPNISTPDNQIPFSTLHNASTHPSSTAVMSQTQAETLPESRFEALLAATQDCLSDIHDDVIVSQTPFISSPSQPIIPAAIQASTDTIHITGTNLFGHLDVRKHNYRHDANKQRLAKRQKARRVCIPPC